MQASPKLSINYLHIGTMSAESMCAIASMRSWIDDEHQNDTVPASAICCWSRCSCVLWYFFQLIWSHGWFGTEQK